MLIYSKFIIDLKNIEMETVFYQECWSKWSDLESKWSEIGVRRSHPGVAWSNAGVMLE